MKPSIFILEITLLNTEPPVWRIVELKQTSTLHELHAVIQIAMGWSNAHLYSFRKGAKSNETEFMLPEYDASGELYTGNNPQKFKLKDIFLNVGDTIEYEYDFGDGWKHEILLKGKTIERALSPYPMCVVGARSCPPEDVGGVHGYAEMLKVLSGKDKKKIKEYTEWLGYEYNPDFFVCDRYDINFKRSVKYVIKGNSL